MGRARKTKLDLTLRTVAELEHDPGGPPTQVVYDTKVTALALRLTRGGRHAWVYNRKTIGHWPDMSPAEARRAVVGKVEDEKDTPTGFTWREGLQHYAENKRTPKKRRLIKESREVMNRVAAIEDGASFIDRPMVATRPDEVTAFLATYADRPSRHNGIRAVLNSCWNHCTSYGKIFATNPVVAKKLKENPRRDFFTESELSQLYDALKDDGHYPWILSYAELTYIWALRGREALRFRWDWVSEDALETPERKTEDRFAFPLWPEAKVALDRLPRVEGCPLLFAPVRAYRGRPNLRLADCLSKIAQGLFPGRKLTPHTLRRSRATHMRDAGYTYEEIRSLTGHASSEQLAAYIGRPPRQLMDRLSLTEVRKRRDSR